MYFFVDLTKLYSYIKFHGLILLSATNNRKYFIFFHFFRPIVINLKFFTSFDVLNFFMCRMISITFYEFLCNIIK